MAVAYGTTRSSWGATLTGLAGNLCFGVLGKAIHRQVPGLRTHSKVTQESGGRDCLGACALPARPTLKPSEVLGSCWTMWVLLSFRNWDLEQPSKREARHWRNCTLQESGKPAQQYMEEKPLLSSVPPALSTMTTFNALPVGKRKIFTNTTSIIAEKQATKGHIWAEVINQ